MQFYGSVKVNIKSDGDNGLFRNIAVSPFINGGGNLFFIQDNMFKGLNIEEGVNWSTILSCGVAITTQKQLLKNRRIELSFSPLIRDIHYEVIHTIPIENSYSEYDNTVGKSDYNLELLTPIGFKITSGSFHKFSVNCGFTYKFILDHYNDIFNNNPIGINIGATITIRGKRFRKENIISNRGYKNEK